MQIGNKMKCMQAKRPIWNLRLILICQISFSALMHLGKIVIWEKWVSLCFYVYISLSMKHWLFSVTFAGTICRNLTKQQKQIKKILLLNFHNKNLFPCIITFMSFHNFNFNFFLFSSVHFNLFISHEITWSNLPVIMQT